MERAALAHPQPSQLWQLAPDGHPSVAQIYQAARQGDDLAQSLLAETVDYLSLAVASLAVVINPEMILLGGEMVHAADLLLGPMQARLAGLLPAMPRLETAQLGADGVILGAVSLVLRNTQADVAGVKIAWP
jgi:glucokinase